MTGCPYCDQIHPEGTRVCPNTGEPLIQGLECPNCGNTVLADWKVCSYCGFVISSKSPYETKELRPRWLNMVGIMIVIGLIGLGVWFAMGNQSAKSSSLVNTILPTATASMTTAPTKTISIVPTPSPQPLGNIIVNQNQATLRTGPGITFDIAGYANFGDTLPYYGMNEEGTWMQVDVSGTKWILTSVVDYPGQVNTINSATPIKPVLTSTSTPHQETLTITAKDGSILTNIPSGKFLMGLSDIQIREIAQLCTNCDPEEMIDVVPQRVIYLDSYWIAQKEITNEQFMSFISATGYRTTAETEGGSYVYSPTNEGEPPYVNGANWQHPFGVSSNISGRGQNPVVQVSWDDANAYCKWAGMRLPTEAEWEKAARGDQGLLFPWGNNPPTSNLLNFNHENHGPIDVGTFPNGVSPYGLYDMAGNVWEWVSDFYLEEYYQDMADSNPTGPLQGAGHPFRGGSWASDVDGHMNLVTTVYRLWNYAYIRSNVIGFRCAMDGTESFTPQFGEIKFCGDKNCSNGPQTVFQQGIKEVYFSFNYQNMVPNSSYGRRWYVNGNLYLDYSCIWGRDWPPDGVFLKKVYDYDYSLAPGEWRLETYIDGQLQATATFTVTGPLRYENFLSEYQCNDTSPTLP